MRRQIGFTLIEIMVVIVILGILATLVLPRILSRPDEARVVKAKQDILTIENAMDLYKLDNGVYPSTDQGIDALVNKPSFEPIPRNWKSYIRQKPVDPWGNQYQYLNPGVHNPHGVDLFSFGANGEEGGEGMDADIGNWTSETHTAQ